MLVDMVLYLLISIHAPRTGSDATNPLFLSVYARNFNPRSPHGERLIRERKRVIPKEFQSTLPARGATFWSGRMQSWNKFQSTLPARGATRTSPPKSSPPRNFNPRSPHGERPLRGWTENPQRISIHAPRTGSDQAQQQSTQATEISIHAPRTGSDVSSAAGTGKGNTFQSTLPARGATAEVPAYRKTRWYFNPRSPHGERQRKVTILSIRIIGFAQKVYHKTVLLRISLAENAVILPKRPRNPVRTSLQKAGGLRFARAIRAARPYSISSPSGA